ncbi:hypothetical protein V8C37DRAFT_407432 [Trichoderma ceciliae]
MAHSIKGSKATATASSPKQSLSEAQYSAGFDLLMRGPGWATYQHFIIPQLSQLLAPLFNSRIRISVLEIGPGPKSVLGCLPERLRRKIKRYAALEPNGLFATNCPFDLDSNTASSIGTGTRDGDDKFDVILFCHSMYGMKPKHRVIERALEMLVDQPEGGMVVVFHRDGTLNFDGLICHRTASFPTGAIRVADDDGTLDCFAAFVTGFVMKDTDMERPVRVEWRKVCRALGRRREAHPHHLLFSSPEVIVAFTQHAIMLPELTAQVPLVKGDMTIKNREARLRRPASMVRPAEVRHVQQCVRWALKHRVGLTVLNVVSVDMSAFDQVHVLAAGEHSASLVVAEAGCKIGDIIRKTMAAGLTVPLGARPSVGAGLWLQGGIGHLARLHGLACDAIIGVVMVSVDSGQVLCIGRVPSQHQPAGAVRLENENDLLWAMKGAGTNFGIVISVTFRAYAAPAYFVRNWLVRLSDKLEARRRLGDFDRVARELPRNCSADAFLHWDKDHLRLGVTMFESSTTRLTFKTPTSTPVDAIFGPQDSSKIVDGVGLFDAEMYMSGMHGGHGGGKTSSFKRCLFLKRIGAANVADLLVTAMETRPSPLCYLHLLQGGGAVADVAAEATAFGCRDWDFACVVTGVWPRDQDGTEAARASVRWVYDVAADLLPLSACSGAYGADLGPDPRDAELAATAFGPNRPRLARLRHGSDPRGVLAYACPLPKAPLEPKLIVLVTGESCAGKDHCAGVWVSALTPGSQKSLTARAVSISHVTKREYAAATGADLKALLWDRAYKEHHRPALTAFFQDQVRQRPRLPEEHFLNVVYGAPDVDVLLITGMRDEAPVAAFSHLVPDSRLLEVRVTDSQETRRARRGCHEGDDDRGRKDSKDSNIGRPDLTALGWRPNLIFDNDTAGDEAAKILAKHHLLPFFHEDLQRLANMVQPISDFPRPGIEFRHVLGISQQRGGLALCASLLQTHFTGDWTKVDIMACCEAGGFVYASALATRVDVPLALIREAGKLPPPTVSAVKCPSHISSSASSGSREKRIEMDRDLIPRGASVVVVDDVLATGETLCAVLQLLGEAGIGAEHVSVIIVAEFPLHRGRELLRRRGFGRANIQSLLVFGGA